MKYDIYSNLKFELEASDEREAKSKATEKFQEIQDLLKDLDVKIENAKVADKKSGYFI